MTEFHKSKRQTVAVSRWRGTAHWQAEEAAKGPVFLLSKSPPFPVSRGMDRDVVLIKADEHDHCAVIAGFLIAT
jgi:hypothetical protein